LAAKWGRVFEVNRPPADRSPPQDQPEVHEWVEIEWIESSPWGAGAYRALRQIIDPKNLDVLYDDEF